jgi:hypothetical protein
MLLPGHIGDLLGVTEAIERESLVVKLEDARDQLSPFGLSAEEIADALFEGVLPEGDTISVAQDRHLESWMSLALMRDGRHECWAVIVPRAGAPLSLATGTGQLLVRAWMTEVGVLSALSAPGTLISYVPKTCSNIPFVKKVLANWNLTCQVQHTIVPAWVGRTQVLVDTDSLVLQPKGSSYDDLFIEILYEPKVKWRFLSMYRVFEHGYLTAVLDTIKSAFLQNPKQSLADGLTQLESELNQLTNLIKLKDLQTHFEEFHDAFDVQLKDMNKYAWAIKSAVDRSGWLKQRPKKWELGVMLFYKLRCSIVHAGMNTPFYEGYDDAAACVNGLLAKTENACLGFLRISVK